MGTPRDKFPKSVLAFYVKLYCKKKATNEHQQQNSLAEATKSWISLSKIEKQYFLSLYKRYETNFRKKFASKLQNAEPYMKKKTVVKRLHVFPEFKELKKENIADSTSLPTEAETGQNEEYFNSFQFSHTSYDGEAEIPHDAPQSQNASVSLRHENVQTTHEPDLPRFISEPTPPVRSGKELFEMIKNEETLHHLNWNDLSRKEKTRYRKAVLSIKCNYIKHYTAYLEQLTPEKLFNYYKSQI